MKNANCTCLNLFVLLAFQLPVCIKTPKICDITVDCDEEEDETLNCGEYRATTALWLYQIPITNHVFQTKFHSEDVAISKPTGVDGKTMATQFCRGHVTLDQHLPRRPDRTSITLSGSLTLLVMTIRLCWEYRVSILWYCWTFQDITCSSTWTNTLMTVRRRHWLDWQVTQSWTASSSTLLLWCTRMPLRRSVTPVW